MTASRFCKVCKNFHDLSEDWPEKCIAHFGATSISSIQIIKDIEPYKAVAIDKVSGKAPRIGSRSEHREFLKRNGYVEIGNERPRQKATDYADIHPREIKQTIDQLRSRR